MSTEKYQERIDEAAQEYIDQFVNGNRQSTFRELFDEGRWRHHELGAIIAQMVLYIPRGYMKDFVRMLNNFVVNRLAQLHG